MAQGRKHQWMRWAPRFLGLLFAVFISLFALDALGAGEPLWQQVFGFLIHLIPTLLVVGVVIVGWRWPLMGGVLCLGLGLLYVALAWKSVSWAAYAAIVGPIWLTGLLFFVDGFAGDA
jgi:hypothetical protein